nr:hypothetical protein CKG001_10490 [Bdellovibrio sp. CKG001]
MNPIDSNPRAEKKPKSSRQKDRNRVQAEKRRKRHRQRQFESYQEGYPERLREHLAAGDSIQTFHRKVKVESSIIYRWIRKHPEFRIVAMEFSRERASLYDVGL